MTKYEVYRLYSFFIQNHRVEQFHGIHHVVEIYSLLPHLSSQLLKSGPFVLENIPSDPAHYFFLVIVLILVASGIPMWIFYTLAQAQGDWSKADLWPTEDQWEFLLITSGKHVQFLSSGKTGSAVS